MYTDPNDQSVWMYHRWLVGTGENGRLFIYDLMETFVLCLGESKDLLLREIAAIRELLQEQPDSRCEFDVLFAHCTEGNFPRVFGIDSSISTTVTEELFSGSRRQTNVKRMYFFTEPA